LMILANQLSHLQGMFDRSLTCRVMPYSINLNNSNSNVKFDIHFDAIKIMLLTTGKGTVHTKPLRMYAFPNQLNLLATLIKLYKLLKNSRLIK